MTSPNSMSICNRITIIWSLCLVWANLVSGQSTVQIGLASDRFCKYPSPINPSVSIPLNTCILTPGARGISLPNAVCDNGNAVQYHFFFSSACGGSAYREYLPGCWDNNDDPIPGIVAYCGSENLLSITSTTTIPAATNLVYTPTGVTTSGSVVTTTPATSQAGTTGSTGSTDSSTSSSSAHGWSSLSYGEKLGAIIALAVGIPSVIAGFCAVYLMRRHR